MIVCMTAGHRKVTPFSPDALPAPDKAKIVAPGAKGESATPRVFNKPLPLPAPASPKVANSPKGMQKGGHSFELSDAEDEEGNAEASVEEGEGEAHRTKSQAGRKGGKEKKKSKAKTLKESTKKGKGGGKAGRKATTGPVHKARKVREEDEEEDEGFAASLPMFLGLTKTTLWKTGRTAERRSIQDEDEDNEEEEEDVRPLPKLDVHDPIKTLRAIWADGEEEEEDERGDGNLSVAGSEGGEVGTEDEQETVKHTAVADSDDEDDIDMMDEPLGALTFRVPPRK
jgi:hypothetical protein